MGTLPFSAYYAPFGNSKLWYLWKNSFKQFWINLAHFTQGRVPEYFVIHFIHMTTLSPTDDQSGNSYRWGWGSPLIKLLKTRQGPPP